MGFNHVTMNPTPINDPDTNQANVSLLNSSWIGLANSITLVPAVANKRISVHAADFASFAGVAIFQFTELTTAGATVTIQGRYAPNQNVPQTLQWRQFPYWTIAAGNALGVFNSNGTATIGIVFQATYVQG